jgi:hypothetical protein
LKKHGGRGHKHPLAASRLFHNVPGNEPFVEEDPMPSAVSAILLATTLVLPLATSAQVVISGVKYDSAAHLRGSTLQLNGAGVRYRGPFKVYTAGLYLPRKASTPEEALASQGAKRIALTMLREIDAGELGRLFTRGVQDNLEKGAFSRLVPGLLRMSQLFSEHRRLAAGDTVTLDWVPGSGTVVSVRGVVQGEAFKEPEFFDALMRIWLGPVPADWQLKETLLGKSL